VRRALAAIGRLETLADARELLADQQGHAGKKDSFGPNASHDNEGGSSGKSTRPPAHGDCKICRRQAQLVEPRRSCACPGDRKTQQEITTACKGARANHVGAAIARHKRAGRIEERDGKLYATQSAGTEQRAAI
jgi:hypothetical protein